MTKEILKDALAHRSYEYEQLLINMEEERSTSIEDSCHPEDILDQTMNIRVVRDILTELDYLERLLMELAEA